MIYKYFVYFENRVKYMYNNFVKRKKIIHNSVITKRNYHMFLLFLSKHILKVNQSRIFNTRLYI